MNRTAVTLEYLESQIASEFTFTAGDGIRGASEMGTSPAGIAESLNRYTIHTIVMKNGFVASGDNACVSAENWSAELGRKYAREKALDKVWECEGYLLASERHQQKA